VCVRMLKSVCMLALLYAVEVFSQTKTDTAMLHYLVDRPVYRTFACIAQKTFSFLDSY